MIVEQVWCKPSYAYGQDNTWKKSRFDTVLVRYSKPNESNNQMDNRRVARLLLLFSIPDPDSETEIRLAHVQLFRTVMVDEASGMFKVAKDRFEVIEIDTIERGVHLIPCFDGFNTPMATATSPPALDAFDTFWLNNQIDLHMYNSVFADGWESLG